MMLMIHLQRVEKLKNIVDKSDNWLGEVTIRTNIFLNFKFHR